MKYYQELTILPCAEVPAYFIWSKVYQQLHLGFASHQDEHGHVPIGISFPDYQELSDGKNTCCKPLSAEKSKGLPTCAFGYRLRLFAMEESSLQEFAVRDRLARLADYVHITSIRPIPSVLKGYANYRRFHQKSSAEQKARRYAKRHNISYEEALALFPAREFDKNVPYIQLKSLTNKNPFRLFIKKDFREKNIENAFGSYGLSDISTVPEF